MWKNCETCTNTVLISEQTKYQHSPRFFVPFTGLNFFFTIFLLHTGLPVNSYCLWAVFSPNKLVQRSFLYKHSSKLVRHSCLSLRRDEVRTWYKKILWTKIIQLMPNQQNHTVLLFLDLVRKDNHDFYFVIVLCVARVQNETEKDVCSWERSYEEKIRFAPYAASRARVIKL